MKVDLTSPIQISIFGYKFSALGNITDQQFQKITFFIFQNTNEMIVIFCTRNRMEIINLKAQLTHLLTTSFTTYVLKVVVKCYD